MFYQLNIIGTWQSYYCVVDSDSIEALSQYIQPNCSFEREEPQSRNQVMFLISTSFNRNASSFVSINYYVTIFATVFNPRDVVPSSQFDNQLVDFVDRVLYILLLFSVCTYNFLICYLKSLANIKMTSFSYVYFRQLKQVGSSIRSMAICL